MEPYVPIPGRPPRKVVIDRKKKEYASIDIEELLDNEGVDFRHPVNSASNW
jgi:dynein heavy chain, axonemal